MIPRTAMPVWIGRWTPTRCVWSTNTALRWPSSMSTAPPPGCLRCADVSDNAVCGGWRVERPDGPVVDALLHSLEVVVVSSRSVKALRERSEPQATSRIGPTPTCSLTVFALTVTVGDRWSRTRRQRSRCEAMFVPARISSRPVLGRDQLRAHLRIVFPGAVGLFSTIDSPISLRFLERFPSATSASWLSEKRLGTWLRANSYSGAKQPAELYARLSAAPTGIIGADGDARRSDHTRVRQRPHRLATPDRRAAPAALDELLDCATPMRTSSGRSPRCATVRARNRAARRGR